MIEIIRVERKPGEPVDAMITRFRRSVNNSGIIAECRKREYYMKPGVRRRAEWAENRKKRKKKS